MASLAGFGQPVMAPPTGYTSGQMIFQDTFAGTTLNTSKWGTKMGGPTNTHWTYPDTGAPVVNNGVTVSTNSVLNTADPIGGTFLFRFPSPGFYIQVNMKCSDMSHGFFPAIWFPQDAGCAPEIDMFEGGFLDGAVPVNQVSHIDYGGVNSAPYYVDTLNNAGHDLTGTFTTYGMELVYGSHANFYVNGSLVLSANNGSQIISDSTDVAGAHYNFVVTPQGTPAGSTAWHSQGPGTGSMEIAEVQVYSLT